MRSGLGEDSDRTEMEKPSAGGPGTDARRGGRLPVALAEAGEPRRAMPGFRKGGRERSLAVNGHCE